MRTVLGLDRIGEYDRLFTGKRIGLITNYSGVDSSWNLNIDLFLKKGYQLVKLFTPEHGLFGSGGGSKCRLPRQQYPDYLSFWGKG